MAFLQPVATLRYLFKNTLRQALLWSAVGIAHVLRSGLVMGYTSSYFTLIVLGYGPPIGVHFRESLVIRLYSEIDQIHLSIEAQCVTTLLPLGDCHKHLVLFCTI